MNYKSLMLETRGLFIKDLIPRPLDPEHFKAKWENWIPEPIHKPSKPSVWNIFL